MRKIASLALTLGTFLFCVSAFSNEMCPDLSRNASRLAQDYRNAVNKVRLACDSSFTECNESREKANELLGQLIAANQSMLGACEFIVPPVDDSFPVTAATVLSAIDTFPTSALIPCQTVDGGILGTIRVGCPNWVLNVPRSPVTVLPLTPTSFSYSLVLAAGSSASVFIEPEFLLPSCTLTASTPTGIPIVGIATFSSATPGGPVNRLQLNVSSISLNAQFSGCGALSEFANIIEGFVLSRVESFIVQAASGLFCGAEGPPLFGPCPVQP